MTICNHHLASNIFQCNSYGLMSPIGHYCVMESMGQTPSCCCPFFFSLSCFPVPVYCLGSLVCPPVGLETASSTFFRSSIDPRDPHLNIWRISISICIFFVFVYSLGSLVCFSSSGIRNLPQVPFSDLQ